MRCLLNRYLQHLLGAAVFLIMAFSPVEGARITGDKGVTPVAPEPSQKPAETASPISPSPATPATRPVTVKNRERVPVQGTDPTGPKREAPAEAPTRVRAITDKGGAKGEPEDSYVTIDFDNVDIPVFIKFISELTGRNFVIDKAVRGKVTIVSPNKISKDEAYKVFESVLEVHGYTTIPAGAITKVVPAVSARSKSVETRLREEATGPEDKVITQLIPLRYADPEDLKKLFTPLISKSSVIISYPPTRTLIVTDVLSNIRRLLSITRAIDVEGVGEEISVIPLEYATATVLAKSLSTVFQKRALKSKGALRNQISVKVVPDERTNSLILLASEDSTAKIKELVRLLDKEPPHGEGDIRVYYLQHANAEDLTKVLTSLPSKQGAETKKGKAHLISKETRIVADKATNSLVIMAGKDDYRVLEEVIRKLDIPRLMVYIEALIMEVNVDKDFSLGVEWQGIKTFTYDGKKGGAFAGSSADGFSKVGKAIGGALVPGFSLGVIGEVIEIGGVEFPNLAAVAHAYQQDTAVHILSTPQILTTDNEEAEIMVGKNIPYLVRQETSEARLDYSSYEYKDVGVTLKVTPQISQERFVRLKIFQEVTRLVHTIASVQGRPETHKRLAQTTVIVKDANTVVIGGLIGDDTTHIDYQVPCLGSIPLIGWFFRSTSKRLEKTNLFVFLTPHIIQNPSEAEKVYHDKKDQIETIKEGVIKMYKRGRKAP
ncbi:MAG: type II secretion system secretin GspD [Deltaproteobacteria bacterium]|nr:type II secretion system secretin GspD [Deltaproteobacteria bacterium]